VRYSTRAELGTWFLICGGSALSLPSGRRTQPAYAQPVAKHATRRDADLPSGYLRFTRLARILNSEVALCHQLDGN
jgi:hypothetical protein